MFTSSTSKHPSGALSSSATQQGRERNCGWVRITAALHRLASWQVLFSAMECQNRITQKQQSLFCLPRQLLQIAQVLQPFLDVIVAIAGASALATTGDTLCAGVGAFVVLPSVVQASLQCVGVYLSLSGHVVIRFVIWFILDRFFGSLVGDGDANQPLMAHLAHEANTLLLNFTKCPSLDALLLPFHHRLADGQSSGNTNPNLPQLEAQNGPNLGFQYLRLQYFEQRVQFLLTCQHSKVIRRVADRRIEGRIRIKVKLLQDLEMISLFVSDLLLQQ